MKRKEKIWNLTGTRRHKYNQRMDRTVGNESLMQDAKRIERERQPF